MIFKQFFFEKIDDLKLDYDVEYGQNILIGENVKIGSNCSIGHNSIIEKNVIIGSNCSIGSNVIIRNTILEDNVVVLDGCVIGKKGFGFFPNNKKNLRYPHIGIVIIGENSEIGCGSTIDRGSMSNTVIGRNTFLDKTGQGDKRKSALVAVADQDNARVQILRFFSYHLENGLQFFY